MKFTPEIVQFLKDNVKGKTVIELSELVYSRFGVRFTVKQITKAKERHKLLSENRGCGKGTGRTSVLPLLSERTDNKGYTFIKVSKEGHLKRLNLNLKGTWKRKQNLIWEQANGTIPKGHIVIFLDGNKNNFELDNLELVKNYEIMKLAEHGLRFNDKELTRTGLAIIRHYSAIYKKMGSENKSKRLRWKFKRENRKGRV